MSNGGATRLRRGAGGAAAVAFATHIAPAGLWLPRLRAVLAPGLASPMPPGTVGVTFDDGPHPEGTPAVLDALDVLGWPATFFVLGSAARAEPRLVAEITRRGHRVGVHGDEHRYLIARGPRAAAGDLRRAYATVSELTGTRPLWWRPPYGVLSGPALVAAARLGLRPLLWSAWGRDWRPEATPESVVDELCSGRLDGGTVLLHDSDATSAPASWQVTVGALTPLAAALDARGLRVAALP